MCEISAKDQRRKFLDQDPPRISRKSANDRLKDHLELSRSTPNSLTDLQLASSLEKCVSEPGFFEGRRGQIGGKIEAGGSNDGDEVRVGIENNNVDAEKRRSTDDFLRELSVKVPLLSKQANKVTVANGLKRDSNGSEDFTNGRKMAPVLGVPPPPPPAPHMGPDGLILPRKPYNPCLASTNHKDLRKELLFNQKVGKNVLNQKSELQRALEKQRETASRREIEKIREESFKDDPRTALQRAIEQRAKHIRLTQEQLQSTMEPPNNLLISARAKLRPRIDSQ